MYFAGGCCFSTRHLQRGVQKNAAARGVYQGPLQILFLRDDGARGDILLFHSSYFLENTILLVREVTF
jgi:hypothetical protein